MAAKVKNGTVVAIVVGAAILGLAIYKIRMIRLEDKARLKAATNIPTKGMEPQVAAKIRTLQGQVQRESESAAAWGKLGMTVQIHGLKEQAIACYQNASTLDPGDFRWSYYAAIAAKETGSKQTEGWFKRALGAKPDYAPLQTRYGRFLFEQGKLPEAEAHFQVALRADPHFADAYLGLAQTALARNDATAAKVAAQKAIEANPSSREAYSVLSDALRRLNDADGAARAQEKAKELPEKTTSPDPIFAALVQEGESAYWYRVRGRSYLQSGLYEMALREFQTSLKLQPDSDGYDNVGVALQGLGRMTEAIEYHKKSIALSPSYIKYYNLGIAYGKLQQYDAAMEAFQNSIRMNAENPNAYLNLGIVYYKLSRWTQAEENLQRAIHYNPRSAQAHYALAMTYLSQNNRMAAVREYEIVKTLDPKLASRFAQAE